MERRAFSPRSSSWPSIARAPARSAWWSHHRYWLGPTRWSS